MPAVVASEAAPIATVVAAAGSASRGEPRPARS